jgi:ribonuclease BN (tRNA processing enzyme)/CheY-like chemotaxis protein
VEVCTAAGTLLVIDCGSGAHGLGQELASQGRGRSGHLLISHTHWDHIQGLPFFAPLFSPANRWDIYAPRGVRQSLQETLSGQMQSTYSPVTLEDLGADIRFHELVEGSLQIGDVQVSTRYLNHPALTLGYRLQADGATLVYASDHEPHTRKLAIGRGRVAGEDLRHVEFLRGADLVIHDAQFTPKEYCTRIGWGHSTGEYAAQMCQMAGAGALALTHHDPQRGDSEVDWIVRGLVAGLDAASPLRIFAAAEGQVLTLAGRQAAILPEKDEGTATAEPTALLGQSAVIGAADPTLAGLLQDAVRADGFRLRHCRTGQEAVDLVTTDRPSLVLLENAPGVIDGIAACRAIRLLPIEGAQEMPVIILQNGGTDTEDEEAGVTERLEAPLSPVYLQFRVQAWMLRQACRWQRAKPPAEEELRLAAVRSLAILDTPPEERFDRLTRLAAAVFDVPVALVTLVDHDRQWFKSRHGLDMSETHRDLSFCAHAIHADDIMVVPDTRLDSRFADSPVVTAAPHVRFYAGYPIRDAAGMRIGTLCLIDTRPRDLDPGKLGLLRDLGSLVQREMCGC